MSDKKPLMSSKEYEDLVKQQAKKLDLACTENGLLGTSRAAFILDVLTSRTVIKDHQIKQLAALLGCTSND